MEQYMRVYHAQIDIIKARMIVRLHKLQAFNLSEFCKKMDASQVWVLSLVESQVLVIHPIILYFTQPFPLPPPMIFDLFMDKDTIVVVQTKKVEKKSYMTQLSSLIST